MTKFIFDSYGFDETTGEATFSYKSVDPDRAYTERIVLDTAAQYDRAVFERVLFLAFILIGISYYKSFPARDIEIHGVQLDAWQADFFSSVYQEGLSQFAFENNKTRDDLAQFVGDAPEENTPPAYQGSGVVSLQSGGKDSLLVAQTLEDAGREFSSLYITSGATYPKIIDELHGDLHLVQRHIDIPAIREALAADGLNGHVPVTYIVLSIGLLQTVLDGKDTLLAAIGHEGEEPHAWIGDLPVNHQWSKTWQAEEQFAEYVRRYISADLKVGSLLRQYSELKIAELFARDCWTRFGHEFSSCNRANYQQGADNSHLSWCGDCPKCANSYLLFAPFVEANELQEIFGGIDLFQKESLFETFKGLLGIDDVMKPFECVGEIDELRTAYHLALQKYGFSSLPFDVPVADFDYSQVYPHQPFTADLLK